MKNKDEGSLALGTKKFQEKKILRNLNGYKIKAIFKKTQLFLKK